MSCTLNYLMCRYNLPLCGISFEACKGVIMLFLCVRQLSYLMLPTLMRYSAICTALRAAPFFIWSLTSQKVIPLGLARSLRMRPTKTSSQFSWKSGMGYFFSSGQSSSASPCPLRTASLNSSTLTGRSVSAHTHSLWQRSEGTRTHMALTWQSVCMIFLVSLYIFISSFV